MNWCQEEDTEEEAAASPTPGAASCGAACFPRFQARFRYEAERRSSQWLQKQSEQGLGFRAYLDPGCPSFLGIMSHKFVGYTPKKVGHPGSR